MARDHFQTTVCFNFQLTAGYLLQHFGAYKDFDRDVRTFSSRVRGDKTEYFKPEYDVFLILIVCFVCLNLTKGDIKRLSTETYT